MVFDTIITDDNTITVYDPQYREAMHSRSGAYNEALYMHVYPSGVLNKRGHIYVLDVGFGLGYNVLALCMEAQKKKNDAYYHIFSLEKNIFICNLMERVNFNDERDSVYELLKRAANGGVVQTDFFAHTVLYGDARQLIKTLPINTFSAVFHDPYSPAKNPELWTVDFFKKLYELCADDGVVTTYSAAVHVRVAMKCAGFTVGRGPQVGRKREGTLASKSNQFFDPLTDDYFASLSMLPRAIPFTDPSLSDDPQTIRDRRHAHMESLRKAIIQNPQVP